MNIYLKTKIYDFLYSKYTGVNVYFEAED